MRCLNKIAHIKFKPLHLRILNFYASLITVFFDVFLNRLTNFFIYDGF